MKALLVINIKDEKRLDDLLLALTEVRMLDAVVLDGRGLRRILAEDSPLFSDWLKGTLIRQHYYSVILAPVYDMEAMKKIFTKRFCVDHFNQIAVCGRDQTNIRRLSRCTTYRGVFSIL